MRQSLLVLTCFTLACAPSSESGSVAQTGSANDPAAVRSAIDAQVVRFEEAVMKGDTATARSVYAEDAMLFPANHKIIRTRAEHSQFDKEMLSAFNVQAVDIVTTDVIVSGDYAIETGTYTMSLTPKAGGKAVADTGKYEAVWRKEGDGSWKMIRDAFTTDLPAPK
jgi:ketosteroid isomerase-like protein